MSKDPESPYKTLPLIFLMEKNSKYKIINSEKYKLILFKIKKYKLLKMIVKFVN